MGSPHHSWTDEPLTRFLCPQCIDERVYYSRLRFWERAVARLTGLRPLRCRRCGWRGWWPDKARVADEPEPPKGNVGAKDDAATVSPVPEEPAVEPRKKMIGRR
jgi:hypothetical protein